MWLYFSVVSALETQRLTDRFFTHAMSWRDPLSPLLFDDATFFFSLSLLPETDVSEVEKMFLKNSLKITGIIFS